MSSTRFLVVAAPRSGSTSFRRALNQNPEIFCHGEIIAENKIIGFFKAPENIEALRKKDPLEFYRRTMLPGFSCTGFKVLNYQVFLQKNAGLISHLVRDKSLKIIHLWRNDLGARYISAIKKTRESSPPDRPLTITREQLIDDIEGQRFLRAMALSAFRNHPSIEVSFEVLIGNPSLELRRVQDFLGTSVQNIELEAQEPSTNTQQIIANEAEIKEMYLQLDLNKPDG